jgi:hypothetical protein
VLPEECFRGGPLDWAKETNFQGPPLVCRNCFTHATRVLHNRTLERELDALRVPVHIPN